MGKFTKVISKTMNARAPARFITPMARNLRVIGKMVRNMDTVFMIGQTSRCYIFSTMMVD